ncbi:uncharacterized protein C8Q71DRAFT_728653 [Rhodofomes roseus]|uniref:SH3 domain-containing protein n=1 Tax=Rhodofomes roseus TaxID=34475 RepID=A0ABQ8KWR8_9APHY|nr:uncharacterized protein C8Q71DRAFT_728653 [Rhodofomes roseus]KAH9843488.1 hypothetical protein C8Q71DRAFT_728653 [Rhodofomes roseus]
MQRPARQDTFDLRDQIIPDDHNSQMMDHAYPSDEEHSVLEDDSDTDDRGFMDDEDDDGSSSLSIPNESIDFDLVYALHSFAATVEGQANVVKGDSLFLMDDSNSYWWLVRVLKTQEVGYIPAENIETPFERLARLNKHRNVDLASATHAELEETRDRLLENVSRGAASPSPTPAGARSSRHARGVAFTAAFSVHRYPPAVWGDEEDEEEDIEWDDEGYEDEDPELAEEQEERERAVMAASSGPRGMPPMEPDDGMSWEDGAVEQMQAREREAAAAAEAERLRQQQQQEQELREQQQHAAQSLRKQPSREQMQLQSGGVEVIPNSPTKPMDPAHVTETRKLTMTPPVARVDDVRMGQDERKRTREEEEEAARKKSNSVDAERAKAGLGPSAGVRPPAGGGKLRKERDSTDDESVREKDKKKKSGGMFGGIFGRKKDKDKGKDKGVDSSSVASAGSDRDLSRESEESGKSSKDPHSAATPEPSSPVTAMARQQQQQGGYRASPVGQPAQLPPQQGPQTPPQAAMASISQHASQLRQRDQQQQALYQQYLNRSPSTPPEAQPSYGLQSASAVLQGSASFASSTSSASGLTVGAPRPRPGSLVLSPSGGMDGLLPDLSVVRVFAGSHLQTEATFKTVLLNASTTAQDLVRQSIQRFRLPAGEDEKDYYLTIKQVEGSSADLLPHERPLGVFESLVEAALELPKVKRSSVGSISSVASNLSMHPAIKKLSMNDFTDDSAVKFYLNRKGGEHDQSMEGEGDETLLAESVQGEDPESPRTKSQYLTVTTTSPTNVVTAERFSSPSYRFPLQLVIYPDDLPDDMVFDPQTEAIVFKNTLRDRPQVAPSPGVPQNMRKKVFVLPRNVTVAEVIEIGLERFGILEGVVDGGDEIEDKATKRRSSSRVRYGLNVDVGGKERELPPSSKVIDSFPRPPTYRAMQFSKRRSVDSAQLLGNPDDVSPDDPIFVLRRAVAYRATSRHRLSAPLDEIALQRMQRNSAASSSAGSDSTVGPAEDTKSQTSQTSKQAIIAAQRAATRASQRATLSAQANEARGLDVALPGGAMVRSLRGEVDNRMRYSYVEPDGETYDISNIVEEEWRGEVGPSTRTDTTADDLLHGVLARGKDGLGAKLDRVLSKIKHEKDAARVAISQMGSDTRADSRGAARSQSPSPYSTADGRSSSRAATATPTASGRASAGQRVPSSMSRMSSYRTASPGESSDSHGKRSVTPNANQRRPLLHERQGSALSEASAYRTATPTSPPVASAGRYQTPMPTPRLVLPKDDFGLSQMMAVIELRASQQNKLPELTPQDRVDELLFGKHHDVNALHRDIRDIYSSTFQQLEEMDQTLEQLLHLALPTHR